MADLTNTQTNAYDYLQAMFASYGLDALAPKIKELLQGGSGEDQISYELSQTPEYKQRFAANDARKKAGLPVLSPAEYLATESAYRQVMQAAGLPKGFYDQHEDFQKWLESDVSPTEVKSRSDLAAAKANSLDQPTKDFMAQAYGLNPNDIASYFLDQKKSLPLLQKQAASMDVGSAAFRQGLGMTAGRADELANSGQAGNADQLFGQVREETREGSRLAGIYGGAYSQRQAEDEEFFSNDAAKQRRLQLAGSEKASFSGQSAVGRSSLGQSNQY